LTKHLHKLYRVSSTKGEAMNWNQNSGPWGPSGGGNKENPWGKRASGSNGGNGNRPPPSGGSQMPPPPDVEAIVRDMQNKLKGMMPGGWNSGRGLTILVLVIGLIWLGTGFYQVGTNQVGVVMRFGAYNRTEQPGLRYALPRPIEEVMLPPVTQQNEIQIGFRTVGRNADDRRSVPDESMMLTQDENIVDVQFSVFWRINDVQDYLYQIRNPDMTVKRAAESVMREVVGLNKLQFILTEGRGQIAEEAKTRLQNLLDEYKSGVIVTQVNLQSVSVPDEVKAAFQDVVNARLDQERFQNEAAAHANKVIPEAKGQAARLLEQAKGYRDQKLAIAEGDAQRFTEVYKAYQMSREVTTKRLYLETMEDVLRNSQKIILDKGSANTYLPLNEMLKPLRQQPSSQR
jgi:modulator of FtsH protease HflK